MGSDHIQSMKVEQECWQSLDQFDQLNRATELE